MNKIGFWGGCFNPPSCAHINLAKELLKNLNLDKIIFVPVGDYYEKEELEDSKHRYNMLKIATSKIDNIEVEDIEINIDKKMYAKDAFKLIQEKYFNEDIYFIMGSDNFINIHKWKEYKEIIQKYKYIIVERPDFKTSTDKTNILYYKPEQTKDISSTAIRKLLKGKASLDNYIDKDVYKYIKDNNLYNT